MNSDPFQDSAIREMFRELLAAIEQQYGPIEYFTVCNHADPADVALDIDEELEVEYPEMEYHDENEVQG